MKYSVLAFFSLALLTLSGSVVAGSSSSATSSGASPASAATTAEIAKHEDSAAHRDCLRETGNRFGSGQNHCISAAGESYSQADIDATGETNLGDALRKLDPSISIRR